MDKNAVKNILDIRSGRRNPYLQKKSYIVNKSSKHALIKHKEGDVWTEDGVDYTIKNGITQTVNISVTRAAVPLFCPKCNNIMNYKYDKKAYEMRGMCFNCLIKEDTDKIIDGTMEEFAEEQIEKNATYVISNVLQEIAIDIKNEEGVVEHVTNSNGTVMKFDDKERVEELRKQKEKIEAAKESWEKKDE